MKEEHSQVCGICEETFATRSKLVKPVQSNMKMIIIEFSVISIVPTFQQKQDLEFCKSKQYQSLYDHKIGCIKKILTALMFTIWRFFRPIAKWGVPSKF